MAAVKNITSIILASCLSVLVFVKSSQASTATYITNSVTTNGASYTAYVHSGSDWDSATAAVLAAINSTPVTNGDSGIVYRVPCDVLKSWGNPYGATYCTAVQTLSVDLRSYQSSNGYTRAWFEWTCHYAVGPG